MRPLCRCVHSGGRGALHIGSGRGTECGYPFPSPSGVMPMWVRRVCWWGWRWCQWRCCRWAISAGSGSDRHGHYGLRGWRLRGGTATARCRARAGSTMGRCFPAHGWWRGRAGRGGPFRVALAVISFGLIGCSRDNRGAPGAGRVVGAVPAGGAGGTDPAAGGWPPEARGPGGAGGDRVRGHVRVHVGPAAAMFRPVRADRAPAVHGVDRGPGVGEALPPGPGRTRRPGRTGLVQVRGARSTR